MTTATRDDTHVLHPRVLLNRKSNAGLAKCRKSPTGSHCWQIGEGRAGRAPGRCRYCHQVRKFSTELQGTGDEA